MITELLFLRKSGHWAWSTAWVLSIAGVAFIALQQMVTYDRERKHDKQQDILQVKVDTTIQAEKNIDERLQKLASVVSSLESTAANRTTDDRKPAVAIAPKKIGNQSQVQGDKEFSRRAIDFANRLRRFDFDYQAKEFFPLPPNLSKLTDDERRDVFSGQDKELFQQNQKRTLEFRAVYLGEAIYLRDELVARLSAKGEKNAVPAPAPDGSLDPIWSGSLAGPEAVPRLADYLEKLARRLSP